ncbi:MAG: hypothetical protein NC432_10920 [Roseburia sp.]|nr:hypothetical protein [Roseburia sp.]MCM1099224.1 hypothetical protein [Ruminococcus flavefaciens]
MKAERKRIKVDQKEKQIRKIGGNRHAKSGKQKIEGLEAVAERRGWNGNG